MKIELDLTPELAEKVKKMLAEEKKEWIKKGDRYYFLGYGMIGQEWWGKDYDNLVTIKRANVYRTRESAEQAERQRLALGAIHQYVRDNDIKMAGFNGYVPDLNDGHEGKLQITGWCMEGEPYYDYFIDNDSSSHGLIFATEEDVRKVLSNCKKELEDLLKVDYSIIR